ncbi:hypothetical protein D9M71_771570 [compost metagenome]
MIDSIAATVAVTRGVAYEVPHCTVPTSPAMAGDARTQAAALISTRISIFELPRLTT